MYARMVCPTAVDLREVGILREPGPPDWSFDSQQRGDRIRAGLTNSGFSLPPGRVKSVMPLELHQDPGLDLPLALAVLLSDACNEELQRDGWIALGSVNLDGTLRGVKGPVVNSIGQGPWVGRIWDPLDEIPDPDDDAVISVVEVANLQQAWDVITFFAYGEQQILAGADPT